jgi:hypothetical protein
VTRSSGASATRFPPPRRPRSPGRFARRLDDTTFKQAWAELEAAGEIVWDGERWVVVVLGSLGEQDNHHPVGAAPSNGNGHVPDDVAAFELRLEEARRC